MALARRTGQPFLHLLQWHTRDVDTIYRILLDEQLEVEAEASEARLIQKAQALGRQMVGG
jgi:hypothetical protein